MLFLCHHKILHKYCFQFLWGPFFIKLPREIEDNAYAKFWVTSKEHYTLRAEALRSCDLSRKIEGPLLAGQQHYGMLWYFLEWSISDGSFAPKYHPTPIILACITDALWAKRGERGILRKAWDERVMTVLWRLEKLNLTMLTSSFISLVFCSNQKCIFDFNNKTHLIRTLPVVPSVSSWQ